MTTHRPLTAPTLDHPPSCRPRPPAEAAPVPAPAPVPADGGAPGEPRRTPEEIGDAFASWAAASTRQPRWTRLPVGPFAIPVVEGTASRAVAGARAARSLAGGAR